MSDVQVYRYAGAWAAGKRAVTYVALEASKLQAIVDADDDELALGALAAQLPGAALVAEPAMRRAAEARAIPVRPLSAADEIARAHIALSLFAREMFTGVHEPAVLMDFFEAAAAFLHATRGPDRGWQAALTLAWTIEGRQFDRHLGAIALAGSVPDLVFSQEDWMAPVLRGQRRVDDIDHFGVRFTDNPPALLEALERAYGLAFVPTPYIVAAGYRVAVDAGQMEQLAALMVAFARRLTAGAPGIAHQPALGGEIEVRFKELDQKT